MTKPRPNDLRPVTAGGGPGGPAPKRTLKQHFATSPVAGHLQYARCLVERVRHLFAGKQDTVACETCQQIVVTRRLLKPDAVAIDVGGHVGLMSNIISRAAPNGQLIIFEPVQSKATALAAAFPKAQVFDLAASDQNDERTFYEVPDNSALSSLSPPSAHETFQTFTVKTVRLDQALPDLERLDFLKVDAEGHDCEAIYGAHALLERYKPNLLFEAGLNTDPQNDPYADLFVYLAQEHGYKIFSVEGFLNAQAELDLSEFQDCRTAPDRTVNFVALVD